MKKIIQEIIKTWESLEGNKNHSSKTIENWLINDMAPVINKARKKINWKGKIKN